MFNGKDDRNKNKHYKHQENLLYNINHDECIGGEGKSKQTTTETKTK